MFKTLFIREIQNNLYSLRFQISFIIVLLVFIIGTISFIVSLKDQRENHVKLTNDTRLELEQRATNATIVAISESDYYTGIRDNAIIDDCNENALPNHFIYSAYNVYGFDTQYGSKNPLMEQGQNLNWSFIISMILSFMTLLLAFDSVSGEKEDRTLALVFSNKVSRSSFILAKFFGIVSIIVIMTIISLIISLIIIIVSGKIVLTAAFIAETLGFLFVSTLFISVMAVIGLTASTLSKQSNISLLICLSVWMLFSIILPNSSVYLAGKLFPIPKPTDMQQNMNQEVDEYYKNLPPNSQMSMDGQPFYEGHRSKAKVEMDVMNIRKKHNNAYYHNMFRQFENTRLLGIISPFAQYEYMNEAALGGGYLRFQKNWNDIHVFQEQFFNWFKNLDAKDDKSPHWYIPNYNLCTTTQAVAPESIPVYVEKNTSFGERIAFMQNYLIAMILVLGIFFAICFTRFLRYDVR